MKIGVNYLKHLIDCEGLDKVVEDVRIEDIDDENVKKVYRNLINSLEELKTQLTLKSDTVEDNKGLKAL